MNLTNVPYEELKKTYESIRVSVDLDVDSYEMLRRLSKGKPRNSKVAVIRELITKRYNEGEDYSPIAIESLVGMKNLLKAVIGELITAGTFPEGYIQNNKLLDITEFQIAILEMSLAQLANAQKFKDLQLCDKTTGGLTNFVAEHLNLAELIDSINQLSPQIDEMCAKYNTPPPPIEGA